MYNRFLKMLIVLIVSSGAYFMISMNSQRGVCNEFVQNYLNEYIDVEIKNMIDALKDLAVPNQSLEEYRKEYHAVRESYKHIEFFVEQVSPVEAKYRINGALVPKYNEYDERHEVDPQGLQQIEAILFETDSLDEKALQEEVVNLLEIIQRIKNQYIDIRIPDQEYLEMWQYELLRMTALNLNGYDATFTQTNVQEAIWTLESMKAFMTFFHGKLANPKPAAKAYKQLLRQIDIALTYLKRNTNFETFDRLNFTTDCIDPLNRSLVAYHNACALPWSNTKSAINLASGNLFSESAFNKQFFSIYYNDTVGIDKQAALGKLLFYDPILSGNNERSCASCHKPNRGFSDGLPKSMSFDKTHEVFRNAPGLVDVIFQKAFFYDGKAYQLEQQVSDVVHNQDEMGSSLTYLVDKLRLSSMYRSLFAEAFPIKKDQQISVYAIQKALSEYEKTLVSFNSRFDQYLAGNKAALTAEEQLGYNLFAGKALCATCHFFPVFNGTVPPYFMDSEYEILGTPADSTNKRLDSDLGRFRVTKANFQKYAFKTPTVRNVQLTAPYMHNGIYPDLKSVLNFYQKGGGEGFKYAVPNQTLPFDTLKLNLSEQKAIIRFLESLTDTSGLISQPFALPVFKDKPDWNKRVWGGKY